MDKKPAPALAASIEEAHDGKHQPADRYEYVVATFTAANTDVVIPYTQLRPNDPNDIRWQDVNVVAVWDGAADQIPHLYRSSSPDRKLWARSYIVLRSSVAGYTTRLLLFTERS